VDEASVEDLLVCVQEALKNSIRFSGSSAPVELDLLVSDHAIRAAVRDRGKGFRPNLPDDLAPLRGQPDPLPTSRRGLFLISSLTDELELISDGGAHSCMVKRLPSR
jgi:anti-sigma regulatory factor (Ser/Thr protein kinase)